MALVPRLFLISHASTEAHHVVAFPATSPSPTEDDGN